MEKRNISFISEDKCTGCYACCNKCTTNAIKMIKNREGFYYPFVETAKCISCGLCITVCPALKKSKKGKSSLFVRANAKDLNIRRRGSSGGIVELVSNDVIGIDGIVYGAAYSQEKKEIIHTSTERVPLQKLLKSKYVQSQINGVFNEIVQNLTNGRTVLFVGTPCQVAGLNSFLGRGYENLVTIDFMCHGVPSPGLFSCDIEEMEKEHASCIADITFRSKINGWRCSTTTTTFEDGAIVNTPNKESMYYMLFLNNYTLRKTCYRCDYYRKHASDITLADDWNVPSNLDDDTGMSLIFINSDKGDRCFENIKSRINYHVLNMDTFDIQSFKHLYSLGGRKEFFSDYDKLSYGELKKKWMSKSNIKKQSLNALIHYYFKRVSQLLNIRS